MNIQKIKYRMTMRKALNKASIEELQICKEELHREFQIRNKKKNG